MHFSLIKMNPPDVAPSHGFDDAILPLYFTLKRLGFSVEILFNKTNPHSRNIVFGSCIAPRRTGRNIPPDSIIFNLEQIIAGSKWCNQDYMSHLHDFEVWDYSEENVDALRAHHINARHVPLGYVPEMTRLKALPEAETGLLFYGLVTDRRHKVLHRLADSGVPLLASQEAFGNLRDALLVRCKAVLNIHQFLPARLEVVRLGYVWANKIPVIAERGEDTAVPPHLEEACLFFPYDSLAEEGAAVLNKAERLRRQGEDGFRAFASRPMEAALARTVGRRVHVVTQMKSEESICRNGIPSCGLPECLVKPPFTWLIQGDMTP